MNRNIAYFAIFVVVIAGLLFVGKSMSHRSAANAAGAETVAITPGGVETPGSVAPEFELTVLGSGGKTMKLSDLKGKGILVNFWATYCGPCKLEMPWMVDLQEKYGPQGFQIVGIADDDAGEKEIMDFAHKLKVNYPILQGTDKIADAYGVRGLPTSIFIDRTGKVVEYKLGLAGEDEIADLIKKSLGDGQAPKTASLR